MKRKMSILLVSALILVLVLAAGAVAAAEKGGTLVIDWNGNPVLKAEEAPAPAPAETQESASENGKMEEELFSGKPDDEVWIIDYSNGGSAMQGITDKVMGLDDLKKRISEAVLPFLVPDPSAGYVLKDGGVGYFVDEQALKSIAYTRTETPYEHITLRRIRPGEDIKRNIEYYNIWFEDANGNEISVFAQFFNGECEFDIGEGDIYEPVPVPGMEKALYIKRTGSGESLSMMQTGFEPIEYVEFYDIDSSHYQWGENTQICDEVLYNIYSKTVQKDVLLSIASSMK